jgi:hypothetical protein
MLRPPWKGLRLLEFEDKYLKVVCFAPEETIKGLQWALDRSQDPDKKFRLFHAPYSVLGTDRQPQEMDLAFAAIDLGQPVPVELLRKMPEVPGLISLMHPTPQQLLQVFELSDWRAIAWDGVNFEKIVSRLYELHDQHKNEIKRKHFVEACRAWVKRSEELPDFIEWTNVPSTVVSPRLFALDSQFGILTLGAEGSGAAIKLPRETGKPVEYGEFRFLNGSWSFRSFNSQIPIEVKGNAEKLKPGDQIVIDGWILAIRKSPRIDDFVRIARQSSIVSEGFSSQQGSILDKTLSDVVKEMLHSGARGELRLSSGLKTGSLFFEDSKLVHARTGPISGRKAALRILGWDKLSWKFVENKMPIPDRRTLNLTFSDFSRIYQIWKTAWQKMAPLQPPPQVKLRANGLSYMKKKNWTVNETHVFSALCEYSMVRDIMNFCSMDDVTIIETLVLMRKQGLVDLVKT